MTHSASLALPTVPPRPAANDLLKERFNQWVWRGLAVAAALHFALLALWPEMTAQDFGFESRALEQMEIPREFEIPPPPGEIQRPAVPVIATSLDVPDDVTIGPMTFSENPVDRLPPPPGGGVDVSEQPIFTPYEVRPELRNRSDYLRALERRYPPMLRDAGIGGTVVLWVYIDESGSVRNTRVVDGSGYEQLDRVAEEVLREVARFTPALNRDQRVPVWIQIPVSFQTR